ncbi:hypothetical protein baBA2_000936 (plasmid) [Borrelia anserina]|uniref:Uncharacterized protein n=2 Tax=Borrelia anserina TaxID=143 RepID=W5SP95_BORAN|nr:hypothetical protein [Borrelia anserina]AHH08994.1 Hypothetical protein BAN_0023300 [Borrelia anserina BA2]APR65342.1 hypothetical protein N187_A23 [Borrelia anserina Es]UPA07310.1 hypothetical protein baBA2_000936 [Borrelia anserina]
MLFGKLNQQDSLADNEDTAVAIKLLALLKDATDSVKVILNDYLSELRLTKVITHNNESVIAKIDCLLDELVKIRSDVIMGFVVQVEKVYVEVSIYLYIE